MYLEIVFPVSVYNQDNVWIMTVAAESTPGKRGKVTEAAKVREAESMPSGCLPLICLRLLLTSFFVE